MSDIEGSMVNPTLIQTESRFIPFDIILIINMILTIILGLIFLFIALTQRQFWSVPMLLVCNSCWIELILSCILLAMATFSLQNDLKTSIGNVSFCNFIAFLCYVTTIIQNYSFLLTALYRYITVIYPNRLFWQSAQCQLSLILGIYIFSIALALPLFLTNQIVYNIDNQICQVPLRLSAVMIYITVVLYVIPNSGIMWIYIKLTRYVRQIGTRTTTSNNLFHAQRELRLIQRTFILSGTLILLGMPYTIFVFISFVTTPPKYHYRIAYFSIDFSVLSIMIMFFCFTQQIIDIIRRALKLRPNVVAPMAATNGTQQ